MRNRNLPEDFRREIEPYLDKPADSEKDKLVYYLKQLAVWLIGIFLFVWLTYNLIGINVGSFKETGLAGNDSRQRCQRPLQPHVCLGKRKYSRRRTHF